MSLAITSRARARRTLGSALAWTRRVRVMVSAASVGQTRRHHGAAQWAAAGHSPLKQGLAGRKAGIKRPTSAKPSRGKIKDLSDHRGVHPDEPDEQTSRLPTVRGSRSASTAMVSVLWGASLPCGGYKKLGNLRCPPGGGAAPPGGGGHLGHVFRGQVCTRGISTSPGGIWSCKAVQHNAQNPTGASRKVLLLVTGPYLYTHAP